MAMPNSLNDATRPSRIPALRALEDEPVARNVIIGFEKSPSPARCLGWNFTLVGKNLITWQKTFTAEICLKKTIGKVQEIQKTDSRWKISFPSRQVFPIFQNLENLERIFLNTEKSQDQ